MGREGVPSGVVSHRSRLRAPHNALTTLQSGGELAGTPQCSQSTPAPLVQVMRPAFGSMLVEFWEPAYSGSRLSLLFHQHRSI